MKKLFVLLAMAVFFFVFAIAYSHKGELLLFNANVEALSRSEGEFSFGPMCSQTGNPGHYKMELCSLCNGKLGQYAMDIVAFCPGK